MLVVLTWGSHVPTCVDLDLSLNIITFMIREGLGLGPYIYAYIYVCHSAPLTSSSQSDHAPLMICGPEGRGPVVSQMPGSVHFFPDSHNAPI